MGKKIPSDIGDHRAKKVGFKTCAIVVCNNSTGKPDENREH
jgi:hypothetical protein